MQLSIQDKNTDNKTSSYIATVCVAISTKTTEQLDDTVVIILMKLIGLATLKIIIIIIAELSSYGMTYCKVYEGYYTLYTSYMQYVQKFNDMKISW